MSGECRTPCRLRNPPYTDAYRGPWDGTRTIPTASNSGVDVETTATIPGRDKIIELGICLFEYDRQSGRIYKVFGSWEWLEDLGFRSRVIATTRISIVDS
jgi:hypothetical protein